ncbi:serine/threonine-protein kinase bud32 [Pleosporales sp. CAS-2024a]
MTEPAPVPPPPPPPPPMEPSPISLSLSPTSLALHTLPAPFSTQDVRPITQGAEAMVYKTTFLTPHTPCVVKYRPPKLYRHATLDRRLTKTRLLAEARSLPQQREDHDEENKSSSSSSSLQGRVYLIDFGLTTASIQDEDKAVDLYVLERAFAATHPAAEPLFQEVLRAYGESYKGAKGVLKRLEGVRMRGRKRSMLG